MKKIINLLMIPLMVISLFSCGGGSGSSSSGGSNTPASMKDLFNNEIVLSSATGKKETSSLLKESYLLDDLMSKTPVVPKKHYIGFHTVRTNKTIYVQEISFKIQSDFEFYIMDLGICDSEANWDYDGYSKDENGKWIFEPDGSVNYHIVPSEEISLSFSFDNFRVKRMRELVLALFPVKETGDDIIIRDESKLEEWKYTIYDLNIVATAK